MTSQHLQEFVPKARYLNQINTQHSTKKIFFELIPAVAAILLEQS